MSAIWGAINLENEMISQGVCECMQKAFEKCKIDRYEEVKDRNVYLGCGIQYFVPEAEKEQLPYMKEGIYFNADVVLDNRQELYKILGIEEKGELLPDGKLLFEVYKKRGKECLNDILGAYTFVWYDSKSRKIEIVLDAVGNRCLYYMKEGNTVYFSSLMEPLVQLKKEIELNDSWFSDFLGLDGVIMFNDTESTPFQDIYRVAPAQYICIQINNDIEKTIYWNPFENKMEYQFATDKEYQEMFLDKWSRAVKDTLRAKEMSILLSGGFDSTAVAAIAAPYLKEKNKMLYSYTSVPAEGYQVDTSGRYKDNESESVKKTAKYYGNIDTTFLAMNQAEPWNESHEMLRTLEFPYKSVQNSLWMEEAMKRAYEKGSRILLTGGYGNISISYSGMEIYANTLYKNGQKRKLKEELTKFSQEKHFSPKYAWKMIEKGFREEYEKPLDLYRGSFVNRNLAEKVGTTDRLEKIEKRIWEDQRDYHSALQSNIHWIAMRQIGEMQTKKSLFTGVLQRDPTCDKRILEFCVHLPISQYSKDGIDRRLVKVYMKDLIPPHVIKEQGMGRQSVDIKYRMTKNWKKTRNAWLELYQKYADSKYVEIPYARQQLLDNEDIECYEQFDLVRQMYTIFALQYEGYIKKCYGEKNEKKLSNIQFCNEHSKISIVVYVHNDEEYFSKCIKSIIEQKYANIEIFLCVDEAEDKGRKLCDEWAKKDNRIEVIYQKSEGEYNTYKKAISLATGEWIAFLKGSDYVEKDFYYELHKRAEENGADLICCKFCDNTKEQRMQIYYDKNILYQYMNGMNHEKLPQRISSYLYKKDTLKNMDICLNDHMWNYMVMGNVHKGISVCTQRFFVKSKSIQKEKDIDSIIAENQLKMEMTRKCFLKKFQENALLDYYGILAEAYCKGNYDKESRKKIKDEWRKNRKTVRVELRFANVGRKKKVLLWLSTYYISAMKMNI